MELDVQESVSRLQITGFKAQWNFALGSALFNIYFKQSKRKNEFTGGIKVGEMATPVRMQLKMQAMKISVGWLGLNTGHAFIEEFTWIISTWDKPPPSSVGGEITKPRSFCCIMHVINTSGIITHGS